MRAASAILFGAVVTLRAHLGAGEWQSFDGYRSARLSVRTNGTTGFALLPGAQTGIRFTNQLAQSRSLTNQIYLNGSGVAAADVDGDGWCDLYFCGLDNQNELFHNLGNWRFERITERAGVGCSDQASTGAALADMDGDGDPDLLVNAIGRGTRLFQNDGKAHFKEVTANSGLASTSGSMSFAIADVNGDGFLDLYVVNYRSSTFRDEPEKRFRMTTRDGRYELISVGGRSVSEPDLAGRFTVDPAAGLLEHGQPDALYLNESGLRFRRVSGPDGTFLDERGIPVAIPNDWGLAAMFRDLNGDGAPDLYVCNDFQSPDRIWINDGKGRFRSAPHAMFRQTSLFSMGVDIADLDGDGREEIFVADMLSRKHARRQTQLMEGSARITTNPKWETRPQVSRNTLFWNRGDGTYAEVAQFSGVEATEWSWSPVFLDVDLDGRRDLLLTTGHERDAQHIDVARDIEDAKKKGLSWREQVELRRKFPKLESPLLAFRNQGELAFREATAEWGFSSSQVAQGIALADLDNDGDLDLAVNCLNSGALIYRNQSIKPRIAVRLIGAGANTRAVGAKITVQVDGLPAQMGEITAAGRYVSSDDCIKSFATMANETARLHVVWPNGGATTVSNASPNTLYEIFEKSAAPLPAAPQISMTAIFEDISSRLGHVHKDEPFDDFQRQPLLPVKFSELGPGVTWFDVDSDGWEDLILGSGRAGSLAYFKNVRGAFSRGTLPHVSAATRRDQCGVLGSSRGTNQVLLMTFSNYEDGQVNGPSVIAFEHAASTVASILDASQSSIGALALGDADVDGDLDLFAAGRIVPGRYPEPASSSFLRSNNGSLQREDQFNRVFQGIGMVSAATWSDLTGDGKPELLLAIEGGPPRVMSFSSDGFRELTAELGLGEYHGWWQSISTGDFNNDGRMDIIAGNLGSNNKYQRFLADGYFLYHGDIGEGAPRLILEAIHDPDSGKIVPLLDRDSLALMLPDLAGRYPTFASFSGASVDEILGTRAGAVSKMQVNTSESMLFLSDESRQPPYRALPLPLPAQFAPVFGIAIGDVDADGNEDVFLAQNLFGAGKRTSRYDAGEGLLLLGNGKGGLASVSSSRSGIKMPGEGRGAAFCDFDHDGRLDLAVGQNSGETKLYANTSPRHGLRVLLRGEQSNPHGVGAQVRVCYSDGEFGPTREIRAGEGYWSQAASTIVLGRTSPAHAVEVLWPGGKRERFPVASDAREVVLQQTKLE